MKYLIAAIAAFTFAASALQAQTTGAVAGAQAGASAGASSGSQSASAVILNQSSPAAVTTTYQGSYKVENVPNVSAPAVFGGGHPCLAGKSGGISVIGGGATFGQGNAEPICMLWLMGQPEAALRLLAMQSPAACKAMANVGYYRVGNQVMPFDCGETKPGGIDTAGAQPRKSRVSTRNAPDALFSKCAMEDGKVRIRYTSAGRSNKAAAQRGCLRELGY